MKTYTKAEADARLKNLPGWEFDKDGIRKSYQFKDFIEAMGFITRLAICSEKARHHAEIFNVYNKVDIRLSTHDAGGLTDRDFDLATQLEEL